MARESALQNKAITYIRKRGPHWVVEKRHGHGAGRVGLPDLSCCCAGLCVQIELKAPGKTPTIRQEHEIAKYNAAGARATWADNMAVVVQVVAACERDAHKLGLLPTAIYEQLNQDAST